MWSLPISVSFISSLLFLHGDAYKILVYNPKFAVSHGNFMGSIADVLADAGHNVTTLMPILSPSLKDPTTKSHIIRVPLSEELLKEYDEVMEHHADLFNSSVFNIINAFYEGRGFGSMFSQLCKETIDNEGLLDQLKNEQFDVMLAENFDMCGIAMSHYLAPKATCVVSTTVLFGAQRDEVGVPPLLSFNPSMFTSSLDVYSMISRAWNLVGEYIVRMTFEPVREATNAVMREKFGPDYPSIYDITSRVAYAFTNAEPLVDFGHPTLHKVIDIGGLGTKEPKPLDKNWLNILSLRPRTTIISFGSVAQSSRLRPALKKSILEMVASFPDVTFIWKYEEPEDDFAKNEASKVTNLILSKWMPQNDLMNDERVVAFISHAGMGSVQETATRGVPALFIPLFGDQPRNAAMMQHNGIAKIFDKHQLSDSSKFTAAVAELLNDESAHKSAKHVSQMLKHKPFSSKEKLIKHVEFAAEFGPSPALRPQSHEMSTVEYFNLDIIFIAFVLSLFLAFAFLYMLKKIVCLIFSVKSKEKYA